MSVRRHVAIAVLAGVVLASPPDAAGDVVIEGEAMRAPSGAPAGGGAAVALGPRDATAATGAVARVVATARRAPCAARRPPALAVVVDGAAVLRRRVGSAHWRRYGAVVAVPGRRHGNPYPGTLIQTIRGAGYRLANDA